MPSSKETLTPEVEPLTSLLLHPLLQDPKFLAAVGGVVILLLVYTCTWSLVNEYGSLNRMEQF